MNQIIFILTTLLSFLCSSCQIKQAPFVKYFPSTAKIATTSALDGTCHLTTATAWAFDVNHMITAGHFCEEAQALEADGDAGHVVKLIQVNVNGLPSKEIMSTILAVDKKKDICILFSSNHPFLPLTLLPSLDKVEAEDPIIVVGAPKGIFPVRVRGFVIAKKAYQHKDSSKELLLLKVDINKGSSGSPVIWNGKVIGMIVEISPRFHNGALAVPASHLFNFIEENVN